MFEKNVNFEKVETRDFWLKFGVRKVWKWYWIVCTMICWVPVEVMRLVG